MRLTFPQQSDYDIVWDLRYQSLTICMAHVSSPFSTSLEKLDNLYELARHFPILVSQFQKVLTQRLEVFHIQYILVVSENIVLVRFLIWLKRSIVWILEEVAKK